MGDIKNSNGNWEVDSDKSLATTTGMTDGAGGGVMGIWQADRQTKLNQLAGASFTNHSSFAIPKGVVGTQNFGFSFANNEEFLGLGFAGQTLDPDAQPLQSTVNAEDGNGNNLGGSPGGGQYVVAIKPDTYANGILTGADASDPLPEQVNISVEPVADAIPELRTNVTTPRPAFVDVVYGGIAGQVVDVNGSPVADVTVSASTDTNTDASTTATNDTGHYTIYAPGGMSTNVTALKGTATESVNTVKGDLVEASFTYGAIKVSVVGPGGTPIENVPVAIGGTEYRTDNTGTALAPALPLKTFTVTIMETETTDIAVNSQGQIVAHELQTGTALTINVRDKRTGQNVRELPGIDLGTGVAGFTNKSGQLQIGAVSSTDYEVLVGFKDRRYHRNLVSKSVPDGEVGEVTIEVEPAITTTNY